MMAEYSDMPVTLDTCNSRAGTAVQEYVARYPVDVIQTLRVMCFSDWSNDSVRKEVQHVLHTRLQGLQGHSQ